MQKLLSGISISRFALGVVFSAISGCGTIGVIILIANLSNAVGAEWRWEIYGAFCLVVLASRVLSRRILRSIALDAIVTLRLRLLAEIAESPLLRLEEIGKSRLFAAVAKDIRKVAEALPNFVVVCANSALIVAGLVYLSAHSWIAGGVTAGFLIVGLASYGFFVNRASEIQRSIHDKWDSASTSIKGYIYGAREFKLARTRGATVLGRIESELHELRELHADQGLAKDYSNAFFQTSMYALLAFFIFAPHARKGAVPDHLLLSYSVVIIYMMSSTQSLLTGCKALIAADRTFKSICELGVQLKLKELPALGAVADIDKRPELELQNVVFYYRNEGGISNEFAVGPISVRCSPGKIYFIVGQNGSGKTTLAKIMCGLYRPSSGQIVFSGVEIEERNVEWFRQHHSVVFSDYFAFGRYFELDRAHVPAARELAGQFGLNLEEKSDQSLLAPSHLSTGQQKRLALISASLDDRPILLLDEWAAEQDVDFREYFYRSFLPQMRRSQKIIIVITHDEEYFDVADEFIRLRA